MKVIEACTQNYNAKQAFLNKNVIALKMASYNTLFWSYEFSRSILCRRKVTFM